MPAPMVALALLTTPLPEPTECAAAPVLAAVAADVFGRGPSPRLVGLTDPGGPFQREQAELQERLESRFGDMNAVQQVDRQLGKR
jgi:hypothetical protein